MNRIYTYNNITFTGIETNIRICYCFPYIYNNITFTGIETLYELIIFSPSG